MCDGLGVMNPVMVIRAPVPGAPTLAADEAAVCICSASQCRPWIIVGTGSAHSRGGGGMLRSDQINLHRHPCR
jgi:hypothetical protein